MRKMEDSPCWYDDQVSLIQELESPNRVSHPYYASYQQNYPCKQELDQLQYINILNDANFLQLPQLESPKVPFQCSSSHNSLIQEQHIQAQQQHCQQQNMQLFSGRNDVQDWRLLDKFVASQLSRDIQDASKETSSYCNVDEQIANLLENDESKKSETGQEYATSTSNSSCQIDMWK